MIKNSILLSDFLTLEDDKLPEICFSKWVIYIITNLVDNKYYIGQTTSLHSRFVSGGRFSHKFGIQDYNLNGGSSRLYKAISEFDITNFKVEILEKINT